MGTSMSSPAAAGAAAIILEGEPDLSPAQLRERIFQSSRRDDQTGQIPNATWGWGKIDVARALEIKDIEPVVSASPSAVNLISTFPAPSNGSVIIEYEVVNPTELTITVFDPSGRTVWDKTFQKSNPGRKTLSIPNELIDVSGMYLVKISDKHRDHLARVMIVR
jgi:subtilisin family serine protease